MDTRQLGSLVRRRWRWVVAGVVAVLLVGAGGWLLLPSSYEAEATVVLLPPSSDGTDPTQTLGQNRFLGLDGLTQAVDVVITSLSGADVQRRLEGRDPTATYKIEPDYTSNAPLMVVTSTGGQTGSEELLDRVLAAIPRELNAIQASVATPEKVRITALTVSRDKKPDVVNKAKLRWVVVIGAAGLAAVTVTIAAADSILIRRRLRRAQRATGDPSGEESGAESGEGSTSTSTADEDWTPGAVAPRNGGQRIERRGTGVAARSADDESAADAAFTGRRIERRAGPRSVASDVDEQAVGLDLPSTAERQTRKRQLAASARAGRLNSRNRSRPRRRS